MTISKDIYPAVDMTVTSTGELMVLRTTKPAIRVFNTNSGGFREINIGVDNDAINYHVRSIGANEEGSIFVVIDDVEEDDTDDEVDLINDARDTDEVDELADQIDVVDALSTDDESDEGVEVVKNHRAGHLCIFNPDGILINKVEASYSGAQRISYCRLTKTIYIANDQNILRYHWDWPTLKKMPPLVHGVDGFECTDISTANDEKVLAAGKIKSTNEVVVFQVVETKQLIKKQNELATAVTSYNKADDTTQLKMIKLTFDDNVNRKLTGNWYPDINVLRNTLALGLKDKVELFHLKP